MGEPNGKRKIRWTNTPHPVRRVQRSNDRKEMTGKRFRVESKDPDA
jgi:hypothetical protein